MPVTGVQTCALPIFVLSQVDVVEINEAFATMAVACTRELGLDEEIVNVNGSGISLGHPIAATGIANIWEVCTHLRGEAGPRQIEGARVGLAHVIGLGSACGLHILEKAA